jgi:hypothetical protein
MILNPMIRKYGITDYVVKSHCKSLMSVQNVKFVIDCFAACSIIV